MANKLSFWSSVILSVTPILAIYKLVPGVNLAYGLLLIPLATILLTSNYQKDNDTRKFYIWILCLSLLSYLYNCSFSWFSSSLFINNILGLSMTFLFLMTFPYVIDVRIFVKCLYFFGVISAAVCVYQRFSLLLTGGYVPTYLPFLQLENEIFDTIEELAVLGNLRPNSFFTEPAHLCIYLAPILYLSLLGKKYLLAAVLILGLFCSGSTSGLLFLVIIFIYWLFKDRRSLSSYVVFFVFVLGAVWLIITIFPTVVLENSTKLSSIDVNSDTRLFQGLVYIDMLDFFQLICGITLNQIGEFLKARNFYVEGTLGYTNGFFFMIISYGILGTLVLLKYLWKKAIKQKTNMGFLLIAIATLASDQILFNRNFLYLMIFVIIAEKLNIYLTQNDEKKENNLGNIRLVR